MLDHSALPRSEYSKLWKRTHPEKTEEYNRLKRFKKTKDTTDYTNEVSQIKQLIKNTDKLLELKEAKKVYADTVKFAELHTVKYPILNLHRKKRLRALEKLLIKIKREEKRLRKLKFSYEDSIKYKNDSILLLLDKQNFILKQIMRSIQ